MPKTLPGPSSLREPTLVTADAEIADATLAASGDATAFERLYRAHVARIHSLARRMIDADEADDVAQDIFVRAWEKLSTFRGEAAFGTWLHRLAVNVILARRKTVGISRQRHDAREDALDAVGARPVTPELGVDFEGAMAALPEKAKQVFVLHDVEGYTHEEIATMLGIDPGTSKSQLARARRRVRQALGDHR